MTRPVSIMPDACRTPVVSLPPSSSRAQVWTLRLCLLALLAGAAAVVAAEEAQASHFRGGTFYSLPTGDAHARLQGQFYWRASAYGTPAVGTLINGNTFGFPITTVGTRVCDLNPGWNAEVTVLNTAEDWMGARIVDQCDGMDGMLVEFPGDGESEASWGRTFCCRISASDSAGNRHVNHPDAPAFLTTKVDLVESPRNWPPITAFPPVYPCLKDAVCWIEIPMVDPEDDAVDIRWATADEFRGGAGTFYRLGDPACAACGSAPPARLHRNNHTIEWDTTGATHYADCPQVRTYYSTQVALMDNDTSIPTPHSPASNSTYTAKHHNVPVDFLVMICADLGYLPHWVTPPSPCGQMFTIRAGQSIAFDIEASSPDPARLVTIMPLTGYPPGATMAWAPNPGNPARGHFSWTTQERHVGSYLLVFSGSDDVGAPLKPCAIRLRVTLDPVVDFTWLFTTTAPLNQTLDPVQFIPHPNWPTQLARHQKTYRWEFFDAAGAPLAVSTQPEPRFTYDFQGPHEVCLTAYASKGTDVRSARVCHTVQVNNRPPLAAFTQSVAVAQREVRFVDAASDRDGQVVRWQWSFPEGTPATASARDPPVIRFPGKGTFVANLTVWDDLGAVGHTSLAVLVPNRPPAVEPVADIEGVAGQRISFQVAASDPDQDRLVLSLQGAPSALALHDGGAGAGSAAWQTTSADAGRYRGVRALAFDGQDAGWWEFQIVVADPVRDTDRDGVADVADNCPASPNRLQEDGDGDGLGDACAGEPEPDLATLQGLPDRSVPVPVADLDRDGVADDADNCPGAVNAAQGDLDRDGEGDACDGDRDGDGAADQAGDRRTALDNCPDLPNPGQEDGDADGVGDACEGLLGEGADCLGCEAAGTRGAMKGPGASRAAAAWAAAGLVALVLGLGVAYLGLRRKG